MEIFEKLQIKVPFQRKQLLVMIAVRTKVFDDCVRSFLDKAPNGIIVNIGCGLDTRFTRLDNGICEWYDLDFPEVITIRKRFFQETARYHFIPSSVLDFNWIHDLAQTNKNRTFLFLAEGVFMYLHEEEVKALVLKLQNIFRGCELAFEACNEFGVKALKNKYWRQKFQKRFQFGRETTFDWGLRNGYELESWNPGIKLLNEWFYLMTKEKKWGLYRILFKIPQLGKMMWILHYTLA